MENRQYSHEFQGLRRSVYKEITPNILDVPPISKGYDPILTETSSRFGIALDMCLFRNREVEFSLLEERFLRLRASHTRRRCGNQNVIQRCVYYFFVPNFVKTDRIVVEWYNDHCVYIRERGPTPAHSPVVGPSAEEARADQEPTGIVRGDLPQTASSREEESTAEDASIVKDLQTPSSGEKESTAEDASIVKDIQTPSSGEKESVPEDAGIVKDTQTPSSGEKESVPEEEAKESLAVECGSERDSTEISIEEESVPEDVGIVKEVCSSSEKPPEAEEGGNEKEFLPEAGPDHEESLPERAATGAEEQSAKSFESCTQEIEKLFQATNLDAMGRMLKPIFVDKNYKPYSGKVDIDLLIDDQIIKNNILEQTCFHS